MSGDVPFKVTNRADEPFVMLQRVLFDVYLPVIGAKSFVTYSCLKQKAGASSETSVSQDHLADMMGVSRFTVNACIRGLKGLHMIEVRSLGERMKCEYVILPLPIKYIDTLPGEGTCAACQAHLNPYEGSGRLVKFDYPLTGESFGRTYLLCGPCRLAAVVEVAEEHHLRWGNPDGMKVAIAARGKRLVAYFKNPQEGKMDGVPPRADQQVSCGMTDHVMPHDSRLCCGMTPKNISSVDTGDSVPRTSVRGPQAVQSPAAEDKHFAKVWESWETFRPDLRAEVWRTGLFELLVDFTPGQLQSAMVKFANLDDPLAAMERVLRNGAFGPDKASRRGKRTAPPPKKPAEPEYDFSDVDRALAEAAAARQEGTDGHIAETRE